MKVLLINGSPRKKGNTFTALSEVAKILEENGVETEIIQLGNKAVRGCIACYKCRETEKGNCIFLDEPYTEIRTKLTTTDGVVIGSPVYYAGINGSLSALLDRLFFTSRELMEYKPAAAVVVSRREGSSNAFDRLNKYFTIQNMPVVSSHYWNDVHGSQPGEAVQDQEGMQTMRVLGRNMAWLLKSIKEGLQPRPEAEPKKVTSFIRNN